MTDSDADQKSRTAPFRTQRFLSVHGQVSSVFHRRRDHVPAVQCGPCCCPVHLAAQGYAALPALQRSVPFRFGKLGVLFQRRAKLGNLVHADYHRLTQFRQGILAKLDETDRPLRLGEGRISGYLSVALGTLSLLAVLCFMFPDYLTTPSLRAGYNLGLLRNVLAAGMVFSGGFGLLTFALNRQKRLGALGLLLTSVALALGGSAVPVGMRHDTPGFIGLDWFILDLLASALLYVTLEKLAPHRRDQPILRPDFWHDGRYFIFNHLAIGVFLFMTVRAVPSLFSWTINEGLQDWFRSLPGFFQFVIVLVTADLMEYATHRAMHEVPFLWRFHAVHHSVERLDWMAGSRLHFLEPLVTRTAVMLPAFILGASDAPLLCYIVWAGFQAGLVHSNFGLELGPLKYLVATPLFHHWHHGSDKEAIDINYAAHLPVLDRLFGTYHMPTDRWPENYGVVGDPLPKGIWRQFLYPFQRREPPPPPV